MTSLRDNALRFAASTSLLLLLSCSTRAGDEDISPSPYQEFDPVTGYMVTVDPAEKQPQGHGQALDEAAAEQPVPEADGTDGFSWLHTVAIIAAIVAVTALLRRRRRAQPASSR